MKFAAASGGSLLDPRELEELVADDRWRSVIDLLPDGLVLIDHRGIVRYLNPAAESINELGRSQLLNQHLRVLVRSSAADCRSVPAAFEDGVRLTREITDRRGRQVILDTRVLHDRAGALSCLLLTQRLAEPGSRGETPSHAPVRAVAARRPARAGDLTAPVMGAVGERLLARGQRAMALGSRLLLTGETGAGKTELARALHAIGLSGPRPFVHVNCASIPEALFESELFGYEAGAFTGALTRGKRGLVEAAAGGTLFLDEVGEIPLASQAKLLRMLDDHAIQPVGAVSSRPVRFQLIAATNRDLRRMVEEKRFRQDLYYRLAAVVIEVPPLRTRRDLIAPLIDHYLALANQRRPSPLVLDDSCRLALQCHDYPGNIRELQNIIEHLSVACEGRAGPADLPGRDHDRSAEPDVGPASRPERHLPLREAVRLFETDAVRRAIARTGSKRKAALLLGVDVATIVRKSRPLAGGPDSGSTP